MLLTSFFPLALLILAVLGSIVFGSRRHRKRRRSAPSADSSSRRSIASQTMRKASAPRRKHCAAIWKTVRELGTIIKESSFLTAKTSAMVCWLFVGSGIFSAAFALLGGQEVIEKWVLSLDMTPVQFMILAQFIIFLLGWPLEWTEIIIIFMPIFIPLLPHFNIDPLFFGLLVALNLQTAFLSPPVAMAAFYLKGVSPPHVTLNQIFAGMMPFMGIQVVALVLLYVFPDIGLWLPRVLYHKRVVPIAAGASRCAQGRAGSNAERSAGLRSTAGGSHARQRNPAHQGQRALYDAAERGGAVGGEGHGAARHRFAGRDGPWPHGRHRHVRRSVARAGGSRRNRWRRLRSATSPTAIR